MSETFLQYLNNNNDNFSKSINEKCEDIAGIYPTHGNTDSHCYYINVMYQL